MSGNTLIEQLRDGYAGNRPFPFNRIDRGPAVQPIYAIDDYDLRGLLAAFEAQDKELVALRDCIENAQQAASETQPDWKHRCYMIMGSLGFDYGDPDFVMPDEQKRIDLAVARAETAERQAKQAEACCDSYANENQKLHDRLETADLVFTDVCDELGCKYDNEAALEAVAELKRERDEARAALQKIVAIPNREYGSDWKEIEEAREIARSVTGKD